VLLSAFPVDRDDNTEQVLRTVATRLITEFKLDGSGFEIRTAGNKTVGVLEIDPRSTGPDKPESVDRFGPWTAWI
jgi:hypothetical protein